jgi:hypothetical protein
MAFLLINIIDDFAKDQTTIRSSALLALAPAWPAIGRSPYSAVHARFIGPLGASGTCEHRQYGECNKKAVQQGRGAATYTQGRPPVPRRAPGPTKAPRLAANNRAKPPINRTEIMSPPQL